MPLRLEQLAGHLGKGPLAPVYTLHGDEPLLAQEAADAIRAAARAAGYSERLVFTVQGAHFDWSSVVGAAHSRGLFDDQRLIELRIPSGKPGKEGGAALAELAAALPEGVLLLLTLPRLDRTALASAWFSALDKAGHSIRLDALTRAQLGPWLARRLAAQGQRVADGAEGEQALALLADRVEGNLLAAHQEVLKLGLLHAPGVLTLADIDAAVGDVARFALAQFTAEVWAGRTGRVLRVLGALQAAGEAAVPLHYQLADDLRALVRIQRAVAGGASMAMALREARVWGDKERLFERLAPQLLPATLRKLLTDAQRCDGVIKGLRHPDWPADAWDALRQLALAAAAAVRQTQAPQGRGAPAPRRLSA